VSERAKAGPAPGHQGAGAPKDTHSSPQNRGSVLQSSIGNANIALMHEALARDGEVLEPSTKSRMETAFGRDFNSVRIHRDGIANDSASSLRAHAYAVGSDVVFRDGAYAPGTARGDVIIAHELAHVAQQQHAQPARTPEIGGNDACEREAASAGGLASSGLPVGALSSAPAQFVGRIDEDVSLGALDNPIIDAAASSVVGDTTWTFMKEMLRGFTGGMSAQLKTGGGEHLKDRLQELTTSWTAIKDFSIGYLKGLGLGLVSPITDIWNLIKTVYEVHKTVDVWFAQKAVMFFQNPALFVKKLGDLGAKFDELMVEAGAQIVAFLKDPSGAGDTLSKLIASLTQKALGKARELGHDAATSLFEFLNLPFRELGEKIGHLIGVLIIQILLLVFSEAIGNAIEAALQAAAKFGEIVAEGAMAVFRFVSGLAEKVVALVEDAGEFVSGLFEGLITKFKSLFEAISGFFEEAAAAVRAPATAGGPEVPGFFSKAVEGGESVPIVPRDPAAVAALKPPPVATQASKWGGEAGAQVAEDIEGVQQLPSGEPLRPMPGEAEHGPGVVSRQRNPPVYELENIADSRVLARNMKEPPPGPGYEAHHIVPGSEQEAAEVRTLLKSKGIDINEGSNGAWLPRGDRYPNLDASIPHDFTFADHPGYFEALKRDLLPLKKADADVIRLKLEQIADLLRDGKYP